MRTEFVTSAVPAEAKKPCAAPVPLPDRDLTDGETQTFWGADRTALRVCESRRAAAITGAADAQ